MKVLVYVLIQGEVLDVATNSMHNNDSLLPWLRRMQVATKACNCL